MQDNTISCNIQGVALVNNYVIRNGMRREIPKHVLKGDRHNSTLINGKVYLNGYELLNNNKWKRTLKAWFYSLV